MRELLKVSFTVESGVTSFDLMILGQYSFMIIFTYLTWLGFGTKRMYLVPTGAAEGLTVVCRRVSLGVVGLSFFNVVQGSK